MREARAREVEVARVVVDADHVRAGARHEVVRELALAAADVEHALARRDALDEEVVVRGQPVLRVDAVVVLDRAAVERRDTRRRT